MGYFGSYFGRYHESYFGSVGGVAPAEPIPTSTTWPIIRDLQLELLGALLPTTLASLRLRAWDANETDFQSWAEAAGGAFRVVHIERTPDDLEPRFITETISEVAHGETVWIAYPRQVDLFGRRLDAIIDQDIADVTRVLGLRARADYADISSGKLGVRRTTAFVVPGEAATLLGVQFQLEYDRTIP